MKFETIKKDNKKKIVIGVSVLVLVGIVLVIGSSFAKYSSVKTIHLVNSTVNYTASDFSIIGMYKNDGGEDISIDEVPTSNYTLNTTKSYCEISNADGTKTPLTDISITYNNGKLTIGNITKKGTKCKIYFDKIIDSEIPVINNVTSSVTKNTITVTVSASDNKGVTEYYYQIDSNAVVKESTNTHTFTGLSSNTNYSIKVYVKDEAGNSSVVTTKTIKTEAETITMTSKYTYNIAHTYTYNGTTYNLNCQNSWTLPIGSVINSTGNLAYVHFYNSSDKDIGSANTDSSYTITGDEIYFACGTLCFQEDTELLAYDEKKKKKLKRKVKDFKEGDKLYTYDEKKDKFIISTIDKIETAKTKMIYAIYLENGDIIRCSRGHSFYVAKFGYKQASELEVGLELIGIDRNYKIIKIEQEHFDKEITLYRLYLDNNTNCFVTSAKVLSYLVLSTAVFTITKQTEVIASSK